MQPPRTDLLDILFCEVQKCHLMQDLTILKFCEKKLAKVVSGGVVGATLYGRYNRLLAI